MVCVPPPQTWLHGLNVALSNLSFTTQSIEHGSGTGEHALVSDNGGQVAPPCCGGVLTLLFLICVPLTPSEATQLLLQLPQFSHSETLQSIGHSVNGGSHSFSSTAGGHVFPP